MIERQPSILSWFTEWQFYQYGLIYMGARMLNNVSASILQFYLVYVLQVNGDPKDPATKKNSTSLFLAIFPLICFLTAVITSSLMGSVYKAIGRKNTFSIGVVFQIGASALLMYIDKTNSYLMYPTVVLMGMA